VQTSNSLLVQRNDLTADRVGIVETERANRTQIDHFDDLASELPAQDVMPFFADTRILTVLPCPMSDTAVSRASRAIEELKAPQRPRSAVQTTRRWTVSPRHRAGEEHARSSDRGGEIGQNLSSRSA